MEESRARRHFFYHGKIDDSISPDEIDACHFCQIRRFATHSSVPITIVNETDDGAHISDGFRFLDSNILSSGVEKADTGFRTGCQCEDPRDCMYSGCHCLGEAASTNGTGSRKKVCAYYSHGAKKGLLRTRMLHSREPIYECHEGCACDDTCPNRVVERGRTVPLQVFRTANRGWGVKAGVDIKKGQFVDRYLGEIITSEEANARRALSHVSQQKDVYLFALDKFYIKESTNSLLSRAPFEVDGEFKAGPTRFVNHSCEPNMRIFARVGDHADWCIHDLALFAIEDIPRGQELTFDYVDGSDIMGVDAADPSKRDDMTKCLCGSENCRGFLW